MSEWLRQNGYVTVRSPSGQHRTFRISTQRPDARFAPGRRVLGLLTGPENTADYRAFAFVDEGEVKLWRRFQGTEFVRLVDVLVRPEVWGRRGFLYARSATCQRCNRLLTTPESIQLGIGPECRKAVG